MNSNANDTSQISSDPDAHEGADVEGTTQNGGASKPGGLGKDGTIPSNPNGVAAGHSETASNFNPEEDEDADA